MVERPLEYWQIGAIDCQPRRRRPAQVMNPHIGVYVRYRTLQMSGLMGMVLS